MSGISTIVDTAISDFKKEIEDKVEQNCKTFCRNILKQAIQNRENAPKKHNFTGNFLNGIVVCLYKNGNPKVAYYSSDETRSATVVKMSFPKKYSFKKDYEGVKSHYNPTIKTDEGLGAYDAKMFFTSHKPEGNNMFDIVVAYTAEYSEFIEQKRKTAGFMRTLQYTEQTGIKFLTI